MSGSTLNSSFGSQITISASQPGAIAPLRVLSPTSRAGAQQSHLLISTSEKLRLYASVQTTGRRSWSEDMPPQAARKSPLSDSFISEGHGEWSETTTSNMPWTRASHNASRFFRSRIGGQHLNSVAPSGILSAAKYK